MQRLGSMTSALIAVMTLASPALAQTGADFFKGKTITYIASTSPGGGYDTYGRLVAEYLQKHLPGSAVVVKNVPGAGHIIGANTIYASKPDGLTIGIFNTGLILNQINGTAGIRFDLGKMSWIGKAASDPRVVVIASQSPIKSWKDLMAQKTPVNFSAPGIGSATYIQTAMLSNVLHMPIKMITGYTGNEDQLGMRRGELVGTIASRSSYQTFVDNGYGRFIAQIGGSETDVPQLDTMVSDPTARRIIALIRSQGDIGRLTAGPPGIPQDRLDALRAAYRAALEDPELRAKAKQLQLPIDPLYGEDVKRRIIEALDQNPQTIALIKGALEVKVPSQKGTIAEYDGMKKVVFKLDDGSSFPAEISKSRTQIKVGGQAGKREGLKVGMKCTVEGSKGAEATLISCD
ncbi:MAG TPA: tripartite tricarboxylate transporter substrate-binding protein [Xanthobacteraceae bacterium]|nr:tripartite tricarboxylate transporter substrate-binding protein [Xanthobacteraceae bacterium]